MGIWLSDERTKARRDRINMIGKSIQTRLFSAVFLVIFMMTFGVGITFFLSSRWYVQYTARKETEHLIRMVQSESDQILRKIRANLQKLCFVLSGGSSEISLIMVYFWFLIPSKNLSSLNPVMTRIFIRYLP